MQRRGEATTAKSAAFESHATEVGDGAVAEAVGPASLGFKAVGRYCAGGMEGVVVMVAVSEGDYRV